MTDQYDLSDKENEKIPPAVGHFIDQAAGEDAALRAARRGWIVPAILCLLLTAASFYYYQQKVARESRTELEVIRADASLRKAHLSALQQQVSLQESQDLLREQALAKSRDEANAASHLQE